MVPQPPQQVRVQNFHFCTFKFHELSCVWQVYLFVFVFVFKHNTLIYRQVKLAMNVVALALTDFEKRMSIQFIMEPSKHKKPIKLYLSNIPLRVLIFPIFVPCGSFSKFESSVSFKGALDNILKFYFWLNFIYHVKCNC